MSPSDPSLEPVTQFIAVPRHGTAGTEINAGDSRDVSRLRIGLALGKQPRFSDETVVLLRSRLESASLTILIVLIGLLIANLFVGQAALWGLRILVVTAIGGQLVLLKSRIPLGILQLRLAELFLFGLLCFQAVLMFATQINDLAAEGDTVGVAASGQYFTAAWCVVLLTYGIFMPNSWIRGAAVLLPMAAVPYIALAVHSWLVPEVGEMLEQAASIQKIPITFVAAAIGVLGSQIISRARREAYKARQLGQYRLLERIGGGGMGDVYRAEHSMLKRPCAIKLIKPENEGDAKTIKQFEKEVKATAKLTHWNTVEIHDYGHSEDGTFYYVMELLPGASLEQLVVRYGPLPPERVVHFLVQVCDALEEAHSLGLVHRDIKPANIFAAVRGGVRDVAKLLDFGLVRQLEVGVSGELGKTTTTCGSPHYIAPEQIESYDTVDGRADIYALGGVAFYLLTGQTVFQGAKSTELLVSHLQEPPRRPSKMIDGVPEDLQAIVLKCLEKSPDDRYADVIELRKALQECECAGDWSRERAQQWWIDNLRMTGTANETAVADESSTMNGEFEPTLEVTVNAAKPREST